MDGVEKGALLNIIDSNCGVRKSHIGKIELKGAYSFFEVDKSKTKDIQKGFKDVEFQGRKVRLELTEGKVPERGRSDKPQKQKRDGGGYKGKKKKW
jgi:ATP-dependent RNA helicase DeaD